MAPIPERPHWTTVPAVQSLLGQYLAEPFVEHMDTGESFDHVPSPFCDHHLLELVGVLRDGDEKTDGEGAIRCCLIVGI